MKYLYNKTYFIMKSHGRYDLYKDGVGLCYINKQGNHYYMKGTQNLIPMEIQDIKAINKFVKYILKDAKCLMKKQ